MAKRGRYFEFLDRCLKDIRTGKLYPAARDRDRINANLDRAGLAGKRSFKNAEELLVDYLEGMDEVEAVLLYEHARIQKEELPDPLEDLETWTDLPLHDYLVIRITVKLNALGADKNKYPQWVSDHIGTRYLSPSGQIAFADQELIFELDRVLDKKLLEAKKVGTNQPKESE